MHNMYNKNSNYISIGEMAKINRTTVPTLRLYGTSHAVLCGRTQSLSLLYKVKNQSVWPGDACFYLL